MNKDNKHSIAILGTGESGIGALKLALAKGYRVFVSDFGAMPNNIREEIQSLNVEFEEGRHTLDKLIEYDEIIKSPGIPNNAPVIKGLKSAGIPVISEIEFAFRFTDAKVIGITGSNGKTTTTLLTHHLLKSSGLNAVAAGNIGNSLSSVLLEQDPDIFVLELSSFQLDDIDAFRPDVGILLNITPDHLDRYDQDMNKYADAKLRLAENMTSEDVLIYNYDDKLIKDRMSPVNASLLELSSKDRMSNGAYFEEGHLIFDCDDIIQVLSTDELPLIGRHNDYNQMAAVLAAIKMGLSFQSIYDGLNTFKNASHRLEMVRELQGVQYINDSKATNVDAVFYALDAIQGPVIWIAGGVNKGNDYDQIVQLVSQKVIGMICLGKDNTHLIDAFGEKVERIMEVTSVEDAVRTANDWGISGDTVLLSPACASFDLFKSYEDRGDQFKDAVLQLEAELNPVPHD